MSEAAPTPLRANRDFLLLWLGEASSQLGFQGALVAYPLLVLALTGSAAKAGLVGFARAVPWLLFSLPAGALVDRLNRKRVMVFSDVSASLALLSIPVALWIGELSLAQIVVVAFLEGAFIVFFGIAETAALRSVVPAGQLADAVAANDARAYAARVAGTPLGGVLFGISHALPFLSDALSYLVSSVLVLKTRKDFQETRSRSARSLRLDMAEGAKWLWAQPFLRAALLFVAGSNLVFAGVVLTSVVVAKENGASPALIGAMLALVGVGGILGALAAPWLRRRISPRAVVTGYNWVYVAIILALAVAQHPAVIGSLLGALAFFGPTWNAVVDGYRISIIPDAMIGRVQSFDSLVAFGTASFGPLIAGILLDAFGGGPTLLVLAAIMLTLAVVATLAPALREIDGSPTMRQTA